MVMVMVGDTEKMIAVGLVWGATNAFMRRGAVIWDRALKSSPPPDPTRKTLHRLRTSIGNWVKLLAIWQYIIPFLINLSASATFFAILSHTPISLAVPVTNATTFAATAVFGVILGERTHLGFAFFGEVHQFPGVLEAHWPMLTAPFHLQAFPLNRRNLAVNGELFQSIFTKPPLVAQLSAFHKLV